MKASEVAKSGKPLQPDEAASLLDRIGARIVAVSQLHHKLALRPAGGDLMDVGEHLYETARTLVAVLSDTAQVLPLRRTCMACLLDSIYVQPITLIVCEVVINALKYAHPSGVPLILSVGCSATEDGTLCVEVVDDGIGFPEQFDPEKSAGLGFRVVRTLAAQLGASISYKSTSLGTHFELALPHAVAAAAKVA